MAWGQPILVSCNILYPGWICIPTKEPAAKNKLFHESDETDEHVDEADDTDAAESSDSSLSESDLELDNESDDEIDEIDTMEGDWCVQGCRKFTYCELYYSCRRDWRQRIWGHISSKGSESCGFR